MKKLLLILALFLNSANAQVVGSWYDQFSQPYGDPHILAWGQARPGGTVTFTTPLRGQPAWLIAAADRAPAYTHPFFGPTAIFNLDNVIWIEQMSLFGSGAELYLAVPIPNDPSLIGVKFRFQVLTPMNNVWRTSLPWEIEIVP